MSDLISRQAVLDILKGFNIVDIISYEHGVIYVQAVINAIYNRLNNLPSVEPEQNRGELKTVGFLTCQCSECGVQFHELEYTNYCPNCGTKWEESQ